MLVLSLEPVEQELLISCYYNASVSATDTQTHKAVWNLATKQLLWTGNDKDFILTLTGNIWARVIVSALEAKAAKLDDDSCNGFIYSVEVQPKEKGWSNLSLKERAILDAARVDGGVNPRNEIDLLNFNELVACGALIRNIPNNNRREFKLTNKGYFWSDVIEALRKLSSYRVPTEQVVAYLENGVK